MQLRIDTLRIRCKWLALALGGLWFVAIGPAYHFSGLSGVEAATVSAACCFLAGCLTFWLSARVSRPRIQVFAGLLGTGIRALLAATGALLMQFVLRLPPKDYLVWLGLFYLVSLGVETFLLLSARNGALRG